MLRYRGRLTDQTHELVVQYARNGNDVWIVPGQPERKQWWRNMAEPHTIELWLGGLHHVGVARVVTDRDGEMLEAGLAAYRSVFPRLRHATVIVRVVLSDR